MTEENKNKTRAHGLTFAENKALKRNQKTRNVVMVEANSAKKFNDELFEKDYAKGYKIPEHEQVHYHVAMEARTFSQDGQRMSKTRVQIFDVATFRALRDQKPYSGFHGFVTHILHDPTLVEAAPASAPVAPKTPPADPGVAAKLIEQLKSGEVLIGDIGKTELQVVANALGIELKKSWKLDKIREVLQIAIDNAGE